MISVVSFLYFLIWFTIDYPLTTLCSLPDLKRSINRRVLKIERTQSSPFSQKWYKAKQQHISKAQKQAIRDFWPYYGIDLVYNETINMIGIFPSEKLKLVLDIGFGTGESLVQMAKQNPDFGYIGRLFRRD